MYPWLDLYAPYLALAALVVAVLALGWGLSQQRRVRALERRYTALTTGADGASLEQALDAHLSTVRTASQQAADALHLMRQVDRRSQNHLQHTALVRYNPFSHTGGDQSFVLALADANGNGAVINSLHAREGTRIYAKPLLAWESLYTLTEEEREAIQKARNTPPAPLTPETPSKAA